jgi:nitrogen fixation protein FixH
VPFEIATRCRAQVFLEGPPTIYELAAPKGSIQGYVEPGTQGSNEIHFTYVDEAGIEIPIVGETTITASRPNEEPADVRSRRLSPGHLVSTAELEPGRWRFEIAAAEGSLRGCFEETVG